ncbi:MAG: hypothetical protein WBK76_00495 [Candidatus Saccharimonadales bacterium]
MSKARAARRKNVKKQERCKHCGSIVKIVNTCQVCNKEDFCQTCYVALKNICVGCEREMHNKEVDSTFEERLAREAINIGIEPDILDEIFTPGQLKGLAHAPRYNRLKTLRDRYKTYHANISGEHNNDVSGEIIVER